MAKATHHPIVYTMMKAEGERLTPVRTAIIEILEKSHEPRTTLELLQSLARLGFTANKTTVYRQLKALTEINIVQEVRFADRTIRYEIMGKNGHHHHLVCLHCSRIADVVFPTELEKQEQIIRKKHGFKILQHSLEFFGICKKCQKKMK